MGATSKHFSDAELRCKCGCGVNNCTQALVDAAEALRTLAGPLIVTSAYRCPTHNRKIGGARNSQHVNGAALDIQSRAWVPWELELLARKVPAIKGIGRAPGYLHIDVRPGAAAEWCYDPDNRRIAYFIPSVAEPAQKAG